jgi:hypothetical protein
MQEVPSGHPESQHHQDFFGEEVRRLRKMNERLLGSACAKLHKAPQSVSSLYGISLLIYNKEMRSEE